MSHDESLTLLFCLHLFKTIPSIEMLRATLLFALLASRASGFSTATKSSRAATPHRFRRRGAPTTMASGLEHAEAWLRRQTLREALPPSELEAAIAAWRADEALWDATKPAYERATVKIETQLRAETRTLRELLGGASSERLLTTLSEAEGDAEATRSFLRRCGFEGGA